MKVNEYIFHFENMERSKAKERLNQLELHVYAKSKEATQTAIHRKLVRTANPPSEVAKRAVTTDDLDGFGGSIENEIKGN